jgi:hypothetical protein
MSPPANGGKLWAITSYFNPQHFARRLENYRTFRARLRAPLLTVELSLDGTFELHPSEADKLLQLRAADVMWHKERLLNIALQAVPADAEKIAWLDCDVVFCQEDWVDQTIQALDHAPLVQPFQNVCELARDASLDTLDHPENRTQGRSLAYGLAAGGVNADILNQNMRLKGWNSGLAWAGRRDVLDRDGFYDACIMGSGNRAMVCAALGRLDYGRDYLQMDGGWAAHYLRWAQAHYQSVGGNVGYAPGTLIHLWHGDLKDRRYADRHREFREFGFDPAKDLALDENRCWRWDSNKPAMHRYVRDYFAARKEDG